MKKLMNVSGNTGFETLDWIGYSLTVKSKE